MTGTDEKPTRDARPSSSVDRAGKGAHPAGLVDRAGKGTRAGGQGRADKGARAGGQGRAGQEAAGQLWRSVRAGAYALGVGVGKARRVVQEVADQPAAQQAADALRASAAKLGAKVVPAVRSAAQGAYSATDKLLKELGSKCDEAARAAEVGRRAPFKAARPGWDVRAGAGVSAGVPTGAEVPTGAGATAGDADGPEFAARHTHAAEYGRAAEPEWEGAHSTVYTQDPPLLSPTARRAAGLLLVIAGVPMLVLPGPGIATIIAGIALMRAGSRNAEPISVDARDLGQTLGTDKK